MAMYAMPLVVVNMGGEMVYILAQRLTAQNVPADKSKRVLQDVIRTMYNKMFIEELFRPQDVYTMHSTRQIFDRLAHSSIMRLNESSMDKLFDLMTMGFKYQMLACSYPQELLHVTLNHLYQLRAKVDDAGPVCELVDECIRLANEKYAAMSPFEFAGLKQTLCRFFADKRVKVSLFLADGLQKNDGTITLSGGGPLPPGFDPPGMISYFAESGMAMGSDTFVVPHANTITDEPLGAPLDPRRQAACKFGHNLYSKEAPAVPPAQQAAVAATAARAGQGTASAGASKPRPDSALLAASILEGSSANAARSNLNMLADLIGPTSGGGDFKLNLFPNIPDATYAGKGGVVGRVDTIVIDGMGAGSNAQLKGVMDDFNIGSSDAAGGDDEDDLLGMMDEASR